MVTQSCSFKERVGMLTVDIVTKRATKGQVTCTAWIHWTKRQSTSRQDAA